MTKPDSAETVTLTKTQLQEMIAAGVQAGLSQQPQQGSLDERVAAEMSRQRPKGAPPEIVPMISRVEYGGTGSRFLGVVVRGRLVNVIHHTKPDSWESDLPEGMVVNDKNGKPMAMTKQYVYETYYRPDLLLVGKPVNPAYRMSPEEIAQFPFPPLPAGSGVGCVPAPETEAA